ncbi:uncharacterized protein EDB91DRAFT_1154613 [Suillus paluster]|uniref:uncharacterized protein n=1 Tax=Suillus paluster TaxID=48578 RepID=UPI001B870C4E|nr:uncharacterized protein EDB91DRAFT_1154613 [Suillus paluster]KAG1731347.1 hypothetical protein EDB91DRAFT_1154613 [Suillus paluster]
MYNALGFGKGDTILAIVAIVIGCPAPWILWNYGERIRNSSQLMKGIARLERPGARVALIDSRTLTIF